MFINVFSCGACVVPLFFTQRCMHWSFWVVSLSFNDWIIRKMSSYFEALESYPYSCMVHLVPFQWTIPAVCYWYVCLMCFRSGVLQQRVRITGVQVSWSFFILPLLNISLVVEGFEMPRALHLLMNLGLLFTPLNLSMYPGLSSPLSISTL